MIFGPRAGISPYSPPLVKLVAWSTWRDRCCGGDDQSNYPKRGKLSKKKQHDSLIHSQDARKKEKKCKEEHN